MQKIILPVSAAPPQARAPDTGAGGGADGTGGPFGLLLSAQVANQGTSKGIGKKSAENGLNPLAALLISALVQGSIFNQDQSQEVKTEDSQRAAAGAAVSGGTDISALAELFSGNGKAAPGQLAQAELRQLLAQADAGFAQGNVREKLAALLASVERGGTGPAAPDAEAAQALGEIRRLFAELVGSGQAAQGPDAPARAAQGVTATARHALAPEGTVPLPVTPAADEQNAQPGGASVNTVPEPLIAGNAALSAEQAQKGEPNDAFAEGFGAKLAGKPEAGHDNGSKSAEAKPETEPIDFGFALKAAQGRETGAAASGGARAEMPAAGTARQAFDGIVDRIALMKDSARKEMEISLKPEFLGKVVIRLSMDDGGLVAKIAASNPRVQDAFLVQAGALQASLESQGLRDVRVVVTTSSLPDASLQQQAERRGQEQREKGRRFVAVDAAAPISDAGPVSAYERVWRTGTIDYLA